MRRAILALVLCQVIWSFGGVVIQWTPLPVTTLMTLALLASGLFLAVMTPRHRLRLPSWRLRCEAAGFGLANGATERALRGSGHDGGRRQRVVRVRVVAALDGAGRAAPGRRPGAAARCSGAGSRRRRDRAVAAVEPGFREWRPGPAGAVAGVAGGGRWLCLGAGRQAAGAEDRGRCDGGLDDAGRRYRACVTVEATPASASWRGGCSRYC